MLYHRLANTINRTVVLPSANDRIKHDGQDGSLTQEDHKSWNDRSSHTLIFPVIPLYSTRDTILG